MVPSITSERYARAFFDWIVGMNMLDAVQRDIEAVEALLQHSAEFAAFMDNPLVPHPLRVRTLTALLTGRVQPATLDFLCFLDQKRRLGELRGIIRAFDKLCLEFRGVLRIVIVSAMPLSPEQVELIKLRLNKRFGKFIVSTETLDPSLIGGFLIRIGDTIIDHSVATKLANFQRNVLNA